MPSKAHAKKIREHIVKAASGLSDTEAVETPELFSMWAADMDYVLNDRFRYGGKLWKCNQPTLHSSEFYPPGATGTESLYAEVAKPGDGTKDNPIAYNNNMELVEGLYYIQSGAEYLCIRSTGIPVYNNLSDLVGLYVEPVNDR